MNTGHDGSLSTCHANSAVDALRRVETLLMQAAPAWPLQAIRRQVQRSIDVVVHLERRPRRQPACRRDRRGDRGRRRTDRPSTRLPVLRSPGDLVFVPTRRGCTMTAAVLVAVGVLALGVRLRPHPAKRLPDPDIDRPGRAPYRFPTRRAMASTSPPRGDRSSRAGDWCIAGYGHYEAATRSIGRCARSPRRPAPQTHWRQRCWRSSVGPRSAPP